MPCDIEQNRQRKHWEYDEEWNAPCKQAMGMLTSWGLTSQFVLSNVDTQVDSKWTWLEGEKILTYLDPGLEVDKGFYWFNEPVTHQIFLRFTGQNFREEFEPGVFRTNAAVLQVLNWDIFPDLKLDLEEGVRYADMPGANANVAINITNEILPNPFGNPSANGTFNFWPLKKCHNCVDEP